MRVKEVQYFRQWWLLIIILVIMVILITGLYMQLALDIPFGNNPMSNSGFIVLMLLLISFFGAFFALRLESGADERGVFFRFYPFQRKFVVLSWNDIDHVELLNYRPLRDYGGWGWRISVTGKGTAYNVSGDKGIMFQMSNGKKRLLGIKDVEIWAGFLESQCIERGIAFINNLKDESGE